MTTAEWEIVALIGTAVHLTGILSALHALMTVRTSQGTAAWCMALVLLPWVSLVPYWLFGRSRFRGYAETLRKGRAEHQAKVQDILDEIRAFRAFPTDSGDDNRFQAETALERLETTPFLRGNHVELLIDGNETFGRMLEDIEAARHYVLMSYFIVNDDDLGRQVKDLLIAKARAGVRVWFLYDEVGCKKLPGAYLGELRQAGVIIDRFHTRKGLLNTFQLNFRNHRKITVVDGRLAYTGGHNIGDEYLGKSKRFGHWRDTHLRFEGPAVQQVQGVFQRDLYWALSLLPNELDWTPRTSDRGDMPVLTIATGPEDGRESCSIMFTHAIHSARRRIWIASPYFVPDQAVLSALRFAGIRGVDVRILLPQNPDHLLVFLAAFTFVPQLEPLGVRFFKYRSGFMHQKVILVDDDLAAVGTANADNRSFRLNFEVTTWVREPSFAKQIETMLERDLSDCRPFPATDFTEKRLPFRMLAQVARLLSPIL